MSQIIVDDQQANVLAKSRGRVEIRDRAGTLLGYVAPIWTDAEITDARKALAEHGPRYTTEQVLRHLESLNHK